MGLKIAFMSQKGGASKSTFARLVGEYFHTYLPSLSEEEIKKDLQINKSDINKIVIYNTTNHESSIHRFIDNLPIKKTVISSDGFSFIGLKDSDISLFDFGADVHEQLYTWIHTDAGSQFVETLDYIFIPARYDHDSKEAMELIINKFKSFPNVTFILCFTDYQDDFYAEFKNYINDRNFMSFYDLFSSIGRAKMIAVQNDTYIKATDRDSTLLSLYAQSSNEADKIKKSMKRIFDTFSYAFYDANTGFIPIQEKEVSKETTSLTLVKEKLDLIYSEITNIPSVNNNISNVNIPEKAIKNFSDFFSQDKSTILRRFIVEVQPFKNKLSILILSIVSLFIFFIFGTIGYFSVQNNRLVSLRNEVMAETSMANTFSRELLRSGATKAIYIEYIDSKPVLVCDETLGLCKMRYDKNSRKGYIELIDPKP